jgi:UDP-glucose 6-dehydrogenase
MIVVRALLDRGIQVVAYDPLAGRAADLELGGRARVVDSVRACVCDADVVLVATPDPEFQSLTADDFSNGSRVLVVDFWRILGDRLTNQPRIDYWPYGRGDHASGVSELVDLWSR